MSGTEATDTEVDVTFYFFGNPQSTNTIRVPVKNGVWSVQVTYSAGPLYISATPVGGGCLDYVGGSVN